MRLIFCALLLLGGCASRGVRCDDHLIPINPPAERAQPAPFGSAQ